MLDWLLFVLTALVILGIIAGFLWTLKQSKNNHQNDTLTIDSLGIYRPIKALQNEILELVNQSNKPSISGTKGAIAEEIHRIDDYVIKSLVSRQQIRRAIMGAALAKSDAASYLNQAETQVDTSEKLRLMQSYEALQGEINHYEEAEKLVSSIDSGLALTTSSLKSLKANILLSDVRSTESSQLDELRGALSSIDALERSIKEANEFLDA
jgi:hypothetical protein